MKKIFFVALFSIFTFCASAQTFEGIIDFKKVTASDTTAYRYTVKGSKVKIEELDKKGLTSGVMLVDSKLNTVIALSPDRKLFMDVPHNTAPVITGKPEVTKTTTSKEVCGKKCVLWRVKNTAENTEIGYWVAEGKFDFFLPLINTLNRKDKLSSYFLSIPDNGAIFPMEATEKSLLRKDLGSIKVTKMEAKKIDEKTFAIPSDFKKFTK